jgi:hypothetical protein
MPRSSTCGAPSCRDAKGRHRDEQQALVRPRRPNGPGNSQASGCGEIFLAFSPPPVPSNWLTFTTGMSQSSHLSTHFADRGVPTSSLHQRAMRGANAASLHPPHVHGRSTPARRRQLQTAKWQEQGGRCAIWESRWLKKDQSPIDLFLFSAKASLDRICAPGGRFREAMLSLCRTGLHDPEYAGCSPGGAGRLPDLQL